MEFYFYFGVFFVFVVFQFYLVYFIFYCCIFLSFSEFVDQLMIESLNLCDNL